MLLFACATEDPQMTTASPSSPAESTVTHQHIPFLGVPSEREYSMFRKLGNGEKTNVRDTAFRNLNCLTRWQRRKGKRIVEPFRRNLTTTI